MVTAGAFLHHAAKVLEAAGISTGRLDVLVVLEDVLNKNRAQILANPDLLITPEQQKSLDSMIARRIRHEPLAYIRGKTEFYGYTFYVDKRVLEPRPESETMIDLLRATAFPYPPAIIDVGTGSGALAITAKLLLPESRVTGLDIDPSCLRVATKNAHALGAQVVFCKSDLLDGTGDTSLNEAVLLCNLPYVPDSFRINPAAMREPRLAIFGGADGLDLYRRLFVQLGARYDKPHYIFTEALPPQHPELSTIAATAGFILKQSADFIQVFRKDTGSSEL